MSNGKEKPLTAADVKRQIAERAAAMKKVTVDADVWPIEIDGQPNPICGMLCAHEVKDFDDDDGNPRANDVYTLCTSLPAFVKDRDKSTSESDAYKLVPPGTFVIIIGRWGLNKLKEFLPTVMEKDGRRQVAQASELAIVPTKKIKLEGIKSMWRFEISANTVSAEEAQGKLLAMPTTTIAPALRANGAADVPF